MAKIKGVPVQELFSDKESGFKIYAFDVLESNSEIEYNKYGNVSIKGEFFGFDIGQEYDITVNKDTGNYKGSYNLVSIERELPKTHEDKRNFLTFSISDKQADVLLKEYPDIINMIKDGGIEDVDVEKLFGIGEKTLNKIQAKVIDSFCIIDLVVRFADYGLSHSEISKLFTTYGSTEKIIYQMENNPYDLLCGVNGIGFKKADKKILNANPELKNSQQRLGEAVKYIIDNSDGDSAIKEDALANKLSGIDYTLRKMLIKSIETGDINNIGDLMYYNGHITTNRLFEMAKYILKKLLVINKSDNIKEFELDLEDYRMLDDMELTDEQLNTITMMNENNFGMLVGSSGVGKSSSTKAYINFLKNNNLTYKISAFTGRASKVIADHTGEPASTIHRMLRYHPSLGWRVNEKEPLVCDRLIIDEVSMASIGIMYRVMKAIDTSKTKILLIADSAQLPSIAHGNVLYDLVQSKLFKINRLTKVFRYGEGGISKIATDTRHGKAWLDSDLKGVSIFGDKQDMIYIPKSGDAGLKALIKTYSSLANKYGVDDVVATTIYNVGKHGTKRVNKILQKVCNPPSNNLNEMEHGDRIFRENDKVMNVKNVYGAEYIPSGINKSNTYNDNDIEFLVVKENSTEDIYNGDIGKVLYITNKYVIVDFDGTHFVYNKSSLKVLEHAYIVSTHKLQGSEADYVVMFYPSSQTFLMNRNLLYVGLTRARIKVILIAKPKTVINSLHKAVQFNRVTNLSNIINLFKERKRDKIG